MAIRLGKLKINRLWMLVGLALLLGLLATWLSVTYLRNREQAIEIQLTERAKGGRTVAVIVPTSDLRKGAVLQQGLVAGREIAEDLVYADTLTVDDFDAIAGKPLLRSVQRGRPLMRQDVVDDRPAVFSQTVTSGMRAITVDIDETNSISQMMRPGDFIDLNLISADPSISQGQSGQQIYPFLQNVKVIATGVRTLQNSSVDPATMSEAQREALSRYATVTVEVTPEEAGFIALAQTAGRIRVTLRSPEDKGVRGYGPLTTAQLLGGEVKTAGKGGAAKAPAPAKVEYIVGGKGGAGAAAPININVPTLPGFPGMTDAQGGAAGGISIPGLPPQAASSFNNALAQAQPRAGQ